MNDRWAIVDCVTTGLHIKYDQIIELSVLVITAAGIEASFSSCIKPTIQIPLAVEGLTGVTNQRVLEAPSFHEIAADLSVLLDGCIFVAHNARFDYAFVKNHLSASGFSLTASVLCTMKLFKKLFPNQPSYQLNDLAQAYRLPIHEHYGTKDNVLLVHQLLKVAENKHALTSLLQTAKACYQQSAVPAKLKTDLSTLPNAPGVYLFYGGHTTLPLYIGKSVSLRQRVLSHFQADYSNAKEFRMAQQVERVEFIATAGELSALLLESELIKTHKPLFNRKLRRKKTVFGFKLSKDNAGYLRTEVACEGEHSQSITLYGSYASKTAATNALRQLVTTHQLCPKLCGLEQAKTACFSFQLKRCLGACAQEEDSHSYNTRVNQAFDSFKAAAWPFQGPIAIKEECAIHQMTQWLKFDQWRYLGSAAHFEALYPLEDTGKAHDVDTYRILASYLKHQLKTNQNFFDSLIPL